jgi:hypothetical protein
MAPYEVRGGRDIDVKGLWCSCWMRGECELRGQRMAPRAWLIINRLIRRRLHSQEEMLQVSGPAGERQLRHPLWESDIEMLMSAQNAIWAGSGGVVRKVHRRGRRQWKRCSCELIPIWHGARNALVVGLAHRRWESAPSLSTLDHSPKLLLRLLLSLWKRLHLRSGCPVARCKSEESAYRWSSLGLQHGEGPRFNERFAAARVGRLGRTSHHRVGSLKSSTTLPSLTFTPPGWLHVSAIMSDEASIMFGHIDVPRTSRYGKHCLLGTVSIELHPR